MTITAIKWTVDRYHRMITAGVLDDVQVELLDGEIIEMAPEGKPHASLSTRAADYLRQLLGSQAQVREGKPITLATSEPQPDIAVVTTDPNYYWEHHPYANDIFWLIEYSDSSLEKDLEIKSKIYATSNISEYWVVNLKEMQLVVFRSPEGSQYQEELRFESGTIQPILIPVSVEVSMLLKR